MKSLLAANGGVKRSIILADPPWQYQMESNQLSGVALNHYNTMSLQELQALDIKKIAGKNCILMMWSTGSQLKNSLELVESWGFTYKTMFMVWVKTTNGEIKNNRLGYYTRQVAEYMIFATRGHTLRYKKNANVSEDSYGTTKTFGNVFMADSTKHSEKPEYPREVIDKMFHNVPKIELFARQRQNENWDYWGNEIDDLDTTTPQKSEEVERIKLCREQQILLAQKLDEAKSTGNFGGITYDTHDFDEINNGLDSFLSGGGINKSQSKEFKYSSHKKHDDYISRRNWDDSLTTRYNFRKKNALGNK
jgi:N6-adenosine-specific RNA methylase IME4